MNKLPSIKTSRLLLRPIRMQDAACLFDYAKMPHVGPLAGWLPHESIDSVRAFIKYSIDKQKHGQPGVFAVCEIGQDRLIGTIEVHSFHKNYKGAIGMVLHPDYWNQGYMEEASLAVMVYAFETLNIKRLVYSHFLENQSSRRLREKLGFTVEGLARNAYMMPDGTIKDEIVSSFTDDDYYIRDYDRFLQIKKQLVFMD